MANEGLPEKDVDPLPGPAKSYAKGEPIPSDMPSADAGLTDGTDKVDDVSKGLATIQRERMDAMTGAYKGLTDTIGKGTARLEEAYKNEGVDPKDLKPFDEKAATARNTTDPIAAFGSFASVFGILASTFTHAPFESALNASAAAMNAIKAGDKEGFERERKAWEDNTKRALDKHKIQHEQYMDAATLLKTNLEAGEAKMRVLAARFGDQKTLFLLENGMDKEVLDLQAARENLHMKLAENMPKIVMANAEMSRLFALGYDPKNPTTEKSQDALVKFQKERAELKRSERTISASGLETSAIMDRANKIMNDAQQRGEPITFDQAYGQARKEVLTEAGKPVYGATLDEPTLHTMAEQYLAGDKSVFQNLGRGIQGSANIVALRETVSKIAKEKGITGTELATRMAEFNGLMAGQRALGTRTANIEMFANETLNMIDVAEEISHTIPRTQFVPINKALQAYERNTGDPKIVKFGAAINSLINTYAKAIAGGQQATVSDKEHAREIITAAQTQQQFDAIMDVVQRELQAARKAPGQVKQEFRELSGASSTIEKGRVPKPGAIIRYDKEGNRLAD